MSDFLPPLFCLVIHEGLNETVGENYQVPVALRNEGDLKGRADY